MTALPQTLAHADWSVDERKRWLAVARLDGGTYRVAEPEPVGEAAAVLGRLAASGGSTLVGIDLPLGLPEAYARRAGITDFAVFLRDGFGRGRWESFDRVAACPAEIAIERPFYPARAGRPGEHTRRHLCDGLGIERFDDLRRRCEQAAIAGRAASPLFWTLGASQVGKAALHGWREVVVPALRGAAPGVSLWPFEGVLLDLLALRRPVLAEVYPGMFSSRLRLEGSKRSQAARAAASPRMLAWMEALGVEADAGLRAGLAEGLGGAGSAEDRFDALLGVLGMLTTLRDGGRTGIEPPTWARSVEGWILGATVQEGSEASTMGCGDG